VQKSPQTCPALDVGLLILRGKKDNQITMITEKSQAYSSCCKQKIWIGSLGERKMLSDQLSRKVSVSAAFWSSPKLSRVFDDDDDNNFI